MIWKCFPRTSKNVSLWYKKLQVCPICYILISRFMQKESQRHNDKGRAKTSLKRYISHFICNVCVWEGAGDRTELQYIDPHSYGHQRCVFLVFQGCSTGGLGTLSAGFLYCILSPTGLVSKLHWGSRRPFGRVWLSLPHLVSNSSDLQLN